MTIDSQWDVQTAIFSTLTGHAPLAASAAIYDKVPENAGFPYVVIGDMECRPLGTQGHDGLEITLSVHSFSRYPGHKELRQIMARVHMALHESAPAVAGQTLVLCHFLSSSTALEDGGQTLHGVQKFQIITEPNA